MTRRKFLRRSLFAAILAVAAGALVYSTCCFTRVRPDIRTAIAEISEAGLRVHLEALMAIGPRPSDNQETTQATRRYLRESLSGWGYEVREEPFSLLGVSGANVLAERLGRSEPQRVLEVGAHYDTVPGSPGADDNASSVAGVLEIARVLSKVQLGKTVRFCFFAAEEDGLIGSQAHMASLGAEYPRRVEGAYILETVGYMARTPGSQATPLRVPLLLDPPDRGDFIVVAGNWASGALGNRFECAAGAYVPELAYFSVNRLAGFVADSARSDHYPYWTLGYPAIMLTDTANFRNPHYHRPTDTLATLDLAFLTGVTRATCAAVLEWALPAGR